MRSSFIALVLPLAAGTALTACGNGDDAESPEAPAVAVSEGTSSARSEADVTFVQGMIPHHEQAVEMADLALDPESQAGAEVVDLARRIKQAQDPEIRQMQSWLTTWGEEQMDMSGDMAGHSMDGMMSASQMAELDDATGAGFDQQWLTRMIEHHRGAVSMAETVKNEGSNPDVKVLADQIISAQQAEITEMSGLLKG